ncbi:MAG: SEL1-like repeat protein [Pararhodobacter sp.]|nr:SEL1-like repeat protein [Pararhodobacter sp.]
MSSIVHATGHHRAPPRHRPLAMICAALAFAGSTLLAAGALADDFVTGWLEVAPEAVGEMMADPAPSPLVAEAPPVPFAEPDAPVAIAPQPQPADAPAPYESRAGLAVDLPYALRALLDEHDGVILSEGPELAQHEGLYVGLFFGSEDDFAHFGPDHGWINGAEDSITQADGTSMRRLALTLDPTHGSGQGLMLMHAQASGPGHAMALILAANRPDIDPHQIARSLRPVAPDAADYFGALPPEAPEGWVRQVRSGLSFALPSDFEVLFAEDSDLALARADDLDLLEAPPPGFEGTIIVVRPMDQAEVEEDFIPVIDRSEVMIEGTHRFFRRDMALSQDDFDLRAILLHSDAEDRRGRRLSLLFVGYNLSDEAAALAEFETVLGTLRLRPSRRFEPPVAEMTALGGLFQVTLPPGWRSAFSGRGYQLFASGNDMAMLQTGMAAQGALAMPHAGFAEPPVFSDGQFLGLPAQIAEGAASQSRHVLGGPMTLVVFDRCLADGGLIVLTLVGERHWQETDNLRAFVEGLRIDLPADAIACRSDLAAAVAAPEPEPEPAPPAELRREVLDGLVELELPRDRFGVDADRADTWSAQFLREGVITIRAGAVARAELESLGGFAEPPVITDETFFGLSARLAIGPAADDLGDNVVQAIIVPDMCLPDDAPISVTIIGWEGDFRERPLLRDVVASIRLNLPEGAHPCRPVIGVAAAPPVPEPAPPAPGPAPVDPAVPPVAPAPGWASFADPAHGLRLDYPTELFPPRPAQPDGSLALEGADGQARLLLLTQPDHFGQGLNGLLAATTGGGLIETLTDMQREEGRDRLEGRRGAQTVVRVHLLAGGRFHILHLEYPSADQARYHEAVARIVASLRVEPADATPAPAPAPTVPAPTPEPAPPPPVAEPPAPPPLPAPEPPAAPPVDPLAALQQAAEAGDTQAMRELAAHFDDAADPRHDPAQAFFWYERAAWEGDALSMFETGRRLARGQGVARDDAQSVFWYRHAVERGVPEALTMLGWMIADGRGAPRDDAEALRLFRQAAAAGHGLAMNHLGVMYREGRIVARDPAQAVAWFRQAAQAEDAQGMMNLGLALAQGSGTPMDPDGAAFWLGLALRSGNEAVVDHVLQQAGRLPARSMMALQRMALDAGHYAGAIDGQYGPLTRQALQDFASGH